MESESPMGPFFGGGQALVSQTTLGYTLEGKQTQDPQKELVKVNQFLLGILCLLSFCQLNLHFAPGNKVTKVYY
jgi:hypothetical protein